MEKQRWSRQASVRRSSWHCITKRLQPNRLRVDVPGMRQHRCPPSSPGGTHRRDTPVAEPEISQQVTQHIRRKQGIDERARKRFCLRDQRIRSSAQPGIRGAASCGERKQLLTRKDFFKTNDVESTRAVGSALMAMLSDQKQALITATRLCVPRITFS